MPLIERDITLTCVSNEVGGPYVGGARWLGVRLTDLLDRAGVGTKADQILSTDVDGMTISTPLDLATDGRDAMIAIGMNGEPLPREHGFPARMVIPGLYGFISATKWLTRLTLTTYADEDAYWTERDWATDAPIKLVSRIDTPKPLAEIKAGETFIGGVAWAQNDGGVAKVAGQDRRRRVAATPSSARGGNDYWRQWYLRVGRRPGPAQRRRPRHRRRRRGPDRRAGRRRSPRLQRHPDRSSSPSPESSCTPARPRIRTDPDPAPRSSEHLMSVPTNGRQPPP